MGCISRDGQNIYNFWEFKKGSSLLVGEFGSPISICADPYTQFPNNYRKNTKPYLPHLVYNTTFNIYVNFTTELVTDPTSWVVRLVDVQGVETDPTVTLVTHVISTGNYRFSLEGEINGGEDTGKQYQFIIKNGTAIEYVGNCFWLEDAAREEELTKIEYRHSVDLDHYDYKTIWSTKYNTLWLDLNQIDDQPSNEIDFYREGSTGLIRNQRTLTSDYVIIEAFQFDRVAHSAMRSISKHDDILLNGQAVTVKTSYKRNANKISNLNNGEIEFWINESMAVNLNG